MESITSTYRVLYTKFAANNNTGYTVLATQDKYSGEFVTVRGNFLEPVKDDAVLKITGHYETHAKYGEQIVIESYQEERPVAVDDMEKLLGSGLLKGIGPSLAARIVKRFGGRTFDVLDNEPDRLLEIKGIGKGKIKTIVAQWHEQNASRETMTFLLGLGITLNFASRIYKKYREQTMSTIRDNPYVLSDEIDGIGFKKADSIALKMGIPRDSMKRCSAGVIYVLREIARSGSTFALYDDLCAKAASLLLVGRNRIEDAILNNELPDSTNNPKLIRKKNRVYLPYLYRGEISIAMNMRRITISGCSLDVDEDLDVAEVLEDAGMEPDDVQEAAVREAIRSKVMVLTGGPGTGKTTTIRSIIRVFEEEGGDILLAAPTGRASRRMKEATGLPAKTIHRLLEFGGDGKFNRDASNPLEGDLLIVDESSMIDTALMSALLEAVPDGMRVILVGDSDQLPSVGPGNVLHDLIDSGVVPVIRLTRIFRQAMNSKIVTNAHRIIGGEAPELRNSDGDDFIFVKVEEPAEIANYICDLAARILPEHYSVPQSAVQVLSPMKKYVCGTENLNAAIQARINPDQPGKASIQSGEKIYRVGDRVMQLRNDYEKGVFNGDVGIILHIQDGEVLVSFESPDDEDGCRDVSYGTGEMADLTLAYACTIHKSQGSEYPIVVVPVTKQHAIMLKRNLLYTAVTRAKQLIVLVGTAEAVSMAVRNSSVDPRNTTLRPYLQMAFKRPVGA